MPWPFRSAIDAGRSALVSPRALQWPVLLRCAPQLPPPRPPVLLSLRFRSRRRLLLRRRPHTRSTMPFLTTMPTRFRIPMPMSSPMFHGTATKTLSLLRLSSRPRGRLLVLRARPRPLRVPRLPVEHVPQAVAPVSSNARPASVSEPAEPAAASESFEPEVSYDLSVQGPDPVDPYVVGKELGFDSMSAPKKRAKNMIVPTGWPGVDDGKKTSTKKRFFRPQTGGVRQSRFRFGFECGRGSSTAGDSRAQPRCRSSVHVA